LDLFCIPDEDLFAGFYLVQNLENVSEAAIFGCRQDGRGIDGGILAGKLIVRHFLAGKLIVRHFPDFESSQLRRTKNEKTKAKTKCDQDFRFFFHKQIENFFILTLSTTFESYSGCGFGFVPLLLSPPLFQFQFHSLKRIPHF
jgi:hypothetical protein